MRILIIGGHGTIGAPVAKHLSKKNEVLIAGRSKGDFQVDIADEQSIKDMYAEVGMFDAVVCIAGEAKWAPFSELSGEDFDIGLRSKLMGQVNLVRLGVAHLNPGGSFTLSTGILAEDPVPMTTSAAMVNGGIHSFVLAVNLELIDDKRINVVALGLVADAVDKYQDYFPGHNPVPMTKVINAYVKSVEGKGSGDIIRVYE
jgi:NAD(P)-dependent dehydrogenase (short-subunit alcohol dehydrogenase family)